MKKLLIQSDDLAMSKAVVDGTVEAIKNGIVKNTGLFVNMDCTDYAVEKVKNLDVCLGIDINLLCGEPVSDKNDVKSLLDEDGKFRNSRDLLKNNKVISQDKYLYYFENDPFPYDEVLIETENQVKKFIELVGRKPEYMNSHSVITPNTEKAAKVIADKYGIKRSSDIYFNSDFIDLAYEVDKYPYELIRNSSFDFVKYIKEECLSKLKSDHVSFYICHAAYIDVDLVNRTSMAISRIYDVLWTTSDEIKSFIKDEEIELITYRDIL